ncbi:MAG: hypothetical protein K2P58_13070 [Hyphomonadaceae bacterium]|nr:hypothetical protein [Hyphomonadaceae bacterium]
MEQSLPTINALCAFHAGEGAGAPKHSIAKFGVPARVELSQFAISVDGRAQALTAGLAVTAEIKTGRRRIIEFLLSPLQRRVEEAGRER